MAEGTDSRAAEGPPGGDAPGAPKRRIALFYVLLAIVVAVGAAISVSLGEEREPQPDIAGGYQLDQPSACLGAKIELEQSGEFVNLTNSDDTISGKLRLDDGRLSGDATCLDGQGEALEGTVEGERIELDVGGETSEGEFVSEPLEAGAPDPGPPSSLVGEYELVPASECVGEKLELEGSETEVEAVAEGEPVGELHYTEDGSVSGELHCLDGRDAEVEGEASDRSIELSLTIAAGGGSEPPLTEEVVATEQREFERTLAVFFVAVAVIMIAARLCGWAVTKVGQPRVMGEVLAGILLGPSLFGLVAPELQAEVFPSDIVGLIGVVANLGLIFYMFMIGLELDLGQLRNRIAQAAMISNSSVALPVVLGMFVAVPLFALLAPPGDFLPFALFIGASISISSFAVLARIMVERRMLKRPIGVVVLASAAVDDVTAWILVALATAIAVAGSALGVLETMGLALLFSIVMFAGVRPLLARMAGAYEEAGRVPGGWIAAIFAGVLLSAYATESIGIALIIGAFVMGMVMPRHAGLTEDVNGRIEDVVVTMLLPLFFAYTGLRFDFGLIDRPELWLVTLLLFVVAVAAKFGSAAIAARVSGFGWHGSAVIGVLMNTRGLAELIVLNLALDQGVISETLFASLVVMALVTTFMTVPLLKLIDRKNRYGAPVDEELEEARDQTMVEFPALTIPERAILIAQQSPDRLRQLRALAEPLARFEPPRELIVADLVRPPRAAASGARSGLQTEDRLLREASREVHEVRDELMAAGIAARGVAFISTDAGRDLTEIAKAEQVDLLLVDGSRPLLGDAVPRGPVGTVLREAPCDVAVLVAREDQVVAPAGDSAVVVPFGAAEHDWAALELGAWICAAVGAPLKLLGAAGDTADRTRLERSLADAGMLVRSYAGVEAEPHVAEQGRQAIIDAAGDAGLLVIGLSARWQQEGLGLTRSYIARTADVPVLFVRRGTRPGALAPSEDVTRFSWSTPGMSLGGLRPGG